MSVLSTMLTRTTAQAAQSQLQSALARTQRAMLEAQRQISTGLRASKPSEEGGDVSAILRLQARGATREQQEKNLQNALGVLNNTDQALGDAYDLALEAHSIASSQIGIGSDATTRAAQATVVMGQIEALVETANRQFQGVSLFSGERSVGVEGKAFEFFLGGVRYLGGADGIVGDFGFGTEVAFNSNGSDGFGALSARVKSKRDLDPAATAATRLTDLGGARAQGVAKGSVVVSVDGTEVVVELSSAETLGDVVTRVNEAIEAVDPPGAAAGSLAVGPTGLALTAGAGHTITIGELDGGRAAGDLGIALTAAGATVVGEDIHPRLTELTEIAALGAGIDWSGGLKIAQGNRTEVVDFGGATTVQDLINAVAGAGLGVELRINAAGTGLDLISQVSGLELSIGENGGGTTAGDLGLRTLGLETLLSDLNHGYGVGLAAGEDDFAFALHDGTQFNVDLDGVTDVAGLLGAISAAAAGAGVTVGGPGDAGTGFNVGLAGDGNGLVFEDGTAGGNDFRVISLGASTAAADLQINVNVQGGNRIATGDLATVRVDSVFTHLIALRDSLGKDDTRGITFAGGELERGLDQLAKARADVSVRARRVEQQQERLSDMGFSDEVALGNLRDADLAEVITRFTQLQNQLQASIQAGVLSQQLSVLDFLR